MKTFRFNCTAGKNMQLEIIFPVTKTDICTMCHWSSECDDCCLKCKDKCNSGQVCALNDDLENLHARWEAWKYIKISELSVDKTI